MDILVTGASGLLGSRLAKLLIYKGYKIYTGYYSNKPNYGIPVKLDVSNENNISKVIDEIKPDVIIHSAALTNVDVCETNKKLAWKINVLGTRNIALYSKRIKSFLIYISTDYVFDGSKGFYKEDDQPNPINYYGFTKLRGEEEVKNLVDEYCIVRPSVIYGSTPASGKINFALWVIEKLKNNESINVVTDQWNSPTLNTNLAEMLIEVLEKRLTGIYHLAGATRINRYEFAKLIAEVFSLNKELIKPIDSNKISWIARRPKDSSLDVRKALSTLSHKPYKIEDALNVLKNEYYSIDTSSK